MSTREVLLREESLNQGLLDFLHKSVSPFHAVSELVTKLKSAGFQALDERDAWNLQPGESYYVTRGDSSILAFRTASKPVAETGFRIVGSHTDSPCLKPKPLPEVRSCSYWKLGVEVYGSPLLATWFDRDLSLAGRVTYTGDFPGVRNTLIDLQTAVASVPNLAIHLNRDANENRTIQRQIELPPVLGMFREGFDLRLVLKEYLAKKVPGLSEVSEYDLCFYDTQPAQKVGLWKDFIAGARLDNLLSVWAGYSAFAASESSACTVLAALDHEEVGSESMQGAQGNFVESILRRIAGESHEAFARAAARSLFVSTDNAHGVHPNYPEKHEPKHLPSLQGGPVIKVNQNQRYATTGETAALFQKICDEAKVPAQRFVARTDMGCGSTIGPILAAKTGMRTLDVGVPTFAMHSIRELAGTKDTCLLAKALTQFFETESLGE